MADLFGLPPDKVVYVVSGSILLLLGIVVLALRRRHPPALAFAGFAISLGVVDVLQGAIIDDTSYHGIAPIYAASIIPAILGAFGLFLYFPRRLQRDDLRGVVLVVAWGLLVRALSIAAYLDDNPDFFTASTRLDPMQVAALRVGQELLNFTVGLAVLTFPLRFRRLEAHETGAARSLAILAVGFFLFANGGIRNMYDAAHGSIPFAIGILGFVGALLYIVLWLRATRGHHSRLARNVLLAAATIAVLLAVAWTTSATYGQPLARILGALTLAYAVLRGQIEGLDLKVRFALSRSTIAAVFIAVFFIASEAAQQFFGDRTGSTYFGIAIAGTLVFAMAPIQRVAEKLAVKVIPVVVTASPSALGTVGEAAYRRAVRLALRDRELSAGEERELVLLAHELALPPARAFAIRDEIVRERA